MTGEIEARRAAAVEERDLRRIANAEERTLQCDRVLDAQRAHLRVVDGRGEGVMDHARSVRVPR